MGTVNETDTEGDIIYSTGQGWRGLFGIGASNGFVNRLRVGEPPQAIPGPSSIEQYAREHEPQITWERNVSMRMKLPRHTISMT